MKRIMTLALVLLMLSPLAVLAQDGPEMDEFVSEDELLTLQYPKEWFIEELGPEMGGLPGIQMASTEKAFGLLETEEITDIELDEEDMNIILILLPADMLAFMSEEPLSDEPTPEELVELITGLMLGDAEESSEVTLTDPETIVLESEREAGYMGFEMETAEGTMIVYAQDGVLFWLMTFAAPDTYTDEVDELVRLIADNIAYAGTGEDLMAAMMGAASEEAVEPTPSK